MELFGGVNVSNAFLLADDLEKADEEYLKAKNEYDETMAALGDM